MLAKQDIVMISRIEDGVVVQALRMHGYEILKAGNGADALEIFKKMKNKIKMIVTDVIMPNMSGREQVEII
jgi:CheY-like chemotaxis protein